MSFKDRYAVLKLAKNSCNKFTLSIDEDDEKILPVLLIVPDSEKADHEHVVLHDVNQLLKLVNGEFIHQDGFILNIKDGIVNINFENSHYCIIELITNFREELNSWINEYSSLGEEGLLNKYNSELTNFYRN